VTDPSSLLILRLSALGDILHTLPSVIALRRRFPQTRLIWAVEAPYAEMTRALAPVEEVVTLSTKRWRRHLGARETWSELSRSVRELRELAAGSMSVDFQGLVKSAVLGSIAGCEVRYGFDRSAIREQAALLFLNREVAVDTTRHVVEQNLELARGVGAVDEKVPEIDFSRFLDACEPGVQELAAQRPIVLNPGAGRPEKLWPVERFAELARRISTRWQPPLVVWGPGEKPLADAIAAASPARLAPPTGLAQLAYLLKEARLFVGGDTGPLHLAAALRAPVVGLFGPTDPRRNGPWQQVERCVETFSSSKRMDGISVDAVMSRIEEVIG
jgi:heptosyltransferase-1